MYKVVLSCFLLAQAITSISQTSPSMWSMLSKITYKKEYDELLGVKVDRPIFSKEIKANEGKEIFLKGYIIPTDGFKSHKEFVFSAFPYSSCFFCGAAGPETVIEVFASEGISYTSESISIKGKLKLNSTDVNRLMFALHDVKLVK
ncbi:MAG: hypothetical protein WAS56_14435 [Saprospiraceae bacterium]|jgi:hypothetical protein|nr:hypothetical protein [Saprospiraceae bacterium]MBK7465940.1 hypothetical protein [Saprospiraceae bacterium]MBK9992604.1 hypothetical protein [Saprospiraceae bacterium]